MKVMKFGGTSVGRPDRMQQVADLVTNQQEPVLVVLSALSGTTNALVEIGEQLSKGNKVEAATNNARLFLLFLIKTSDFEAI